MASGIAGKTPSEDLRGIVNPSNMGVGDSKEGIKTEPEDIKPDIDKIKEEPMDTNQSAIKQEPGDVKPTIKSEAPDVKPDIKKEDQKPSTSSGESAPPQKPLGANKVKFTKEQLKEALEPPLMKMHAQVRQLSLPVEYKPRAGEHICRNDDVIIPRNLMQMKAFSTSKSLTKLRLNEFSLFPLPYN